MQLNCVIVNHNVRLSDRTHSFYIVLDYMAQTKIAYIEVTIYIYKSVHNFWIKR